MAITKWFSSIHGIWIWIFECATYSVGVIGKKCIGLGYSVPCRQIYVVFCAWDICKSLDQSSKLHHSPLHSLACSTTFSWRKNKTFLKKSKNPYNYNKVPCTASPTSAPQAWPPKNPYNYNRVPSTTGPRKCVCLHTCSLGPSGLAP